MSAPLIGTGLDGDRHSAVPVDELADWAWILGRVEDWLRQAQPEVAHDWAHFAGPGGIRLADVAHILGEWAVRMRNLAEGRR
jgi:hypothetical protein